MASNVDAALIEYLRLHASFLFFLLDKNNNIIGTNQFTAKIIGKDGIGLSFENVLVDFCHPHGLAGFFSRDKDAPLVPLSVNTAEGLPRTFYFMFFDLGDVRAVFGDMDYDEVDKLQRQFILLNGELVNTTRELQKKNVELENALGKVRTLEGILPICSKCKKIRIEGADPRRQDNWLRMEKYIEGKTQAHFSHGVCPDCMDKLYPMMHPKP